MSTASPGIDPAILHQRRERVFLVLAGLFLGTLTMLNLLGISRFLVLASYGGESGLQWGIPGELTFAVAVGVLPYPITFLCTDLISEFYGRKRANFLVLVGLLLNLWVVLILWIGGELPGFLPNDAGGGFPVQPEYNADKGLYEETGWTFYQIRFLAISSVFASMIAYLAAQLIDVQVFHFWKRLTKGKHLWLRNNGSTIISQFVDTFAVITITHFYAHALPVDDAKAIWPQLWLFIITGFVFKLVAALIDTPVIYLAVAFFKKYLHLDPTAEHNADVEEIQMFSSPQ
ncbi:queuosine precursor transporter [Algisphaera agarilytica]|uniref:Probable queuosine precursor transporter n=1 Tax=Algisphaera agarilytica TaxID=1385975 RepID=A0A7X0LMK9_9BACT|nr:queuosine precursor transporter [Algisphaera agarilytica]MBB6431731.1 hypothetical protein [Algisphaera agarilytica]